MDKGDQELETQREAQTSLVSDGYRWTQLGIGVICMVMIANLQYGWTFFVPDIQKTFGWDRAAIQWHLLYSFYLRHGSCLSRAGSSTNTARVSSSSSVACSALRLGDQLPGHQPRRLLSRRRSSPASAPARVYGTCVGNALKWFPDRRGLAAGITAAGFGAGSALTVAPIQWMIGESGFQARLPLLRHRPGHHRRDLRLA